MSAPVQGHVFSGENLAPQPVSVAHEADMLQVISESGTVSYAFNSVRISDRIGRVPRFLYFPDGKTLETPDNDLVDAWENSRRRGRAAGIIHWLEQRSRVAAGATVLLVASVSALLFFGLPVLARRAAFVVPASIERKAGEAAMQSVRKILQPSGLSPAERALVQRQLNRLTGSLPSNRKPELVFQSMGGKNPNAFALPGGFIVVTDEIVKLAKNDDELAAVLAHEIGHQECRHGLQSVFRGSAALLVVSSITGDLSTLTTFSSTIPFLLLQRGYSREFEAEADQHAIGVLLAAKIDPHNLAKILTALENEQPENERDFSYLSTHPSTAERIRAIEAQKHAFGAVAQAADTASVTIKLDQTRSPAAADVAELSDLGRDGTPPQPVSQVAPDYPTALRRAEIQGSVVVEYIVDREGNVHDVQVIRSSHRDFEAPAIAAVVQWKFVPGRKSGRPVNVRVQQEVSFNLSDAESDQRKPAERKP